VGVVAFVAGLLMAISVPAALIGTQSIIAVIFLMSYARDPLHAFFLAMLIFAGAFLSFLLEVLFLPWRRTSTERTLLSLSFERLAEMASVTDDNLEPYSKALRVALVQSQAILLDSDDYRPQGRAFFALQGEAEQMRLLLIVLHQLKQNLLERLSKLEEGIICLEQLLQETSIELQSVSRQLTLGPKALRRDKGEEQPQSNEKIKALLSRAQQWQASSPEQKVFFQNILAYGNRMVDLLYRIKCLAQTWQYPDPQILAEYTIHQRSTWAELYNVQEILKANLTLRSTAFRHAIRLAVTLALATAIYHIPGFPIGRGYWIPFTAFLVLKPDFNTTLTRSVSRLVGTLGGVILAAVLLATLKPTLEMLVVIDAIAAYIALSSFFVNYTIYSAFMTIAAVFLLAFITPDPLTNVFDRAIDTLLGGSLALLMFLIWPTWEHTHIYSNTATRVDTLRNYFIAVMETYIHPRIYHSASIAHLHREECLAHSNVDASLERITREPSVPHFNALQVQGLLEALNSISLSVLTLEGYQINKVVLSSAMRYRLSFFTEEIDKILQQLSQTLTTAQPGTISCAAIDTALHALIEAETSEQSLQKSLAAEQSFLVKEGEQIVHTIDIISQLLPISDLEHEAVTA
jgi:uncharacterized membrane protein YccC